MVNIYCTFHYELVELHHYAVAANLYGNKPWCKQSRHYVYSHSIPAEFSHRSRLVVNFLLLDVMGLIYEVCKTLIFILNVKVLSDGQS
jgi:hypothetical protein